MKKLLTSIFYSLALAIFFLLLLSLSLTQKSFYDLILQNYLDHDVSLELTESYWHPLKPSVIFDEIHIKNELNEVLADDIYIELSLLNILKGNPVSELRVKEVIIKNKTNLEKTNPSTNIMNVLRDIEILQIENLKIISQTNKNLLRLNLKSLITKDGPYIEVNLKDKNENSLGINIISSQNSEGSLLVGSLSTPRFIVEKELIEGFCKFCNFDLDLTTNIKFTFYDDKPLNLLGNLDLKLNKDFYGFSSLSSSFQLRDLDEPVVQFSSLLNQYDFPDFFIQLSDTQKTLIFPEINFSQNAVVEKILGNLNSSFKLKGIVKNMVINFDDNKQALEANLEGISLERNDTIIEGIDGRIQIFQDAGYIKVSSPVLEISSPNSLEKDLRFNNFNSKLDFEFFENSFQIIPSNFSTYFSNKQLEGLLSFNPIPTSGAGDISIRMTSRDLDDKSALSLFPKTAYLRSTRATIDRLIDSATLENVNLIYRGPIDGIYKDNSGSFSMIAEGKDTSIDINGYKVANIDSSFSVNDFSLIGTFTEGNFLGSRVHGDFQTYKKDAIYYMNINGKSEGPFSTILKTLSNSFGDVESSGYHESSFKFMSPLKKEISLLDEEAFLEFNGNLEEGELKLTKQGYYLDNIFSSLTYDSENGLDEGFISLKVNSTPLLFEFDKEKSSGNFSVLNTEDVIPFKNLLPNGLSSKFLGSSKTLMEIAVPSLIRGSKIKKPYLQLKTNLSGTTIDLPLPFNKGKDESKEFLLTFFPFFNETSSRLEFKYGELIRGKFNFPQESPEGFIIFGKAKQSISLEQEKISVIGKIKSLDLSLFSLAGSSSGMVFPELDIKKLVVDEILISDFVFPKTTIISSNSGDLLGLKVKNRNISGKFFFPRNYENQISAELDYINLNYSETDSGQFFSNLYNSLKTDFKFQTDSLILNNNEYGKWAFDYLSSDSSFILDNIIGTYGKWGLAKNSDNISRLSITKRGLGWKTNLKSEIYSGSPEKGFRQIGIEPNFEMDTISLESDISWSALPWKFSYRGFEGDININIDGLLIKDREDLQAQNNILRLVNIFNVTDSFEKVTNLDFRKLYKSGFSADSVDGVLTVSSNSIQIKSPLVFKSGSSEFKWKGEIVKDKKGNLDNLDLDVVMTLPLREYLPAYAFLLGGPVTAGIVYIAGKAFERNLDQISSGSWSIKGTLKEPKTNFNGWFEESPN